MTPSMYLTARCPRGCERWGTPESIERHVHDRRCRGVAWFRRPVVATLIEPEYAKLIQGTEAVELVVPWASTDVDHRDRPTSHRPYAVYGGARLRSPIVAVPPRVWWLVVKHHLNVDVSVQEVVNRAMTADGFASLVPDGFLERFSECPVCGELVANVAFHRRSNNRCRATAAANRVLDLWEIGYRDPWTAPDHPPLSWAELQVVRWKRRIAVVELPRRNAVLIDRA